MPTALLVGLLLVWIVTFLLVLALCLTAAAGERELVDESGPDPTRADLSSSSA